MTLKELRKHYDIPKYKHEGKFMVFSYTAKALRMAKKYLCLLNNKGSCFWVDGFEPTDKLTVLEEQIEKHIKSLPYDSEYYMPLFKKGLFEEYVIHDYMESLGFKKQRYSNDDDLYVLQDKNIYKYT